MKICTKTFMVTKMTGPNCPRKSIKFRKIELFHGKTVSDITETISRKFDENPIIRTEVI